MKASRHTVCSPHRQSSCGSIKACSSPPDSAPWPLSCLCLLLLLSHLSQRGQYSSCPAQDRHLVDLALHGSCYLAPITVFSCSWHFCHLSSRVTCLRLCLCTCSPLMSQGQHANIFLPSAIGTTFEHRPNLLLPGFSAPVSIYTQSDLFLLLHFSVCDYVTYAHMCVYTCFSCVSVCVYMFCLYMWHVYECVYTCFVCGMCMCGYVWIYINIWIYALCVWVCMWVCVCVSLCVHVNGYEC